MKAALRTAPPCCVGLESDWSMQSVIEAEKKVIQEKIGDREHVICALSGGVDSTVAATLVHSVIGSRLHCVFVDNGLLRYKEGERVMRTFREKLHLPVTMLDAKAEMMAKLRGVTDPELKRKAIGKEFIECFMRFRCAWKNNCVPVRTSLVDLIIMQCNLHCADRGWEQHFEPLSHKYALELSGTRAQSFQVVCGVGSAYRLPAGMI